MLKILFLIEEYMCVISMGSLAAEQGLFMFKANFEHHSLSIGIIKEN